MRTGPGLLASIGVLTLALDMAARRAIARHRASEKDPWTVFHAETFQKMDWIPGTFLCRRTTRRPTGRSVWTTSRGARAVPEKCRA